MSQAFGANPDWYAEFGLPGHEGLDFPVPIGSPVRVVLGGMVYSIYNSPTGHNYGRHVRVSHPDGRMTVYAHLDRIDVAAGQTLTAGQQIGLSGNTGQSTGPHLHLAVKLPVGQVYTDSSGQPWPFNFTNPYISLKHLYLPPGRVLKTGYVYRPYLTMGSDGQAVNFSSNLNMRTGPGATHALIGSVPALSLLEVTGPEQDNYIQVRAMTIPATPQPTYQYNGPAVTFSPALHAPGSDWEWAKPEVQSLYNQLNIPVKFMSDGSSSNYFQQFNKPQFHLVRVFWKATAAKSPLQAWEQDIRDGVMAMYAKGARKFELLNEPNLAQEGAGLVWTVDTLGEWLRGLADIIKANCPGSKLYFPGMSPGVPFSNQFMWTNKAWPVVKAWCDGFALHAYTDIVDNQTAAVNDIVNQVKESQAYLNLQVPLVVSEASVNRAASASYKAAVYKAIENKLKVMPGIEGICYYISSWTQVPPEQDSHMEDWIKWGIGAAYSAL